MAITPRFKFLFILNNLEKFFTFFKLNISLFLINRTSLFTFNYFYLFLRYFYSKQFLKLMTILNLNLIGAYNNNLVKSSIYFFFSNILILFKNVNQGWVVFDSLTPHEDTFLFNFYFFAIKTVNFKINKTFFKNIFFFFMSVLPFLWYQHTNFFKFYINFFFTTYNLQLHKFYNGYFLRIHNY